VELRPEYGNEFHCDLDFPDDQEIIRNLTEACEVVELPPSLLVEPGASPRSGS
jgi:hypothetical protein